MPTKPIAMLDANPLEDGACAPALFSVLKRAERRWVASASMKSVSDAMRVKAARASGCRGLVIGFESLDIAVLSGAGRSFNDLARYRDVCRVLREEDVAIPGCFVLGFDGADASVFHRLRRLAVMYRPQLLSNVLKPIRISRSKLVLPGELERAADLAARKLQGPGVILILFDSDGACPAQLGSSLLQRATVARAGRIFRVAVAHHEFKARFLAPPVTGGKTRPPVRPAAAGRSRVCTGSQSVTQEPHATQSKVLRTGTPAGPHFDVRPRLRRTTRPVLAPALPSLQRSIQLTAAT